MNPLHLKLFQYKDVEVYVSVESADGSIHSGLLDQYSYYPESNEVGVIMYKSGDSSDLLGKSTFSYPVVLMAKVPIDKVVIDKVLFPDNTSKSIVSAVSDEGYDTDYFC